MNEQIFEEILEDNPDTVEKLEENKNNIKNNIATILHYKKTNLDHVGL